jgi:cysteine-rich repeat protein
VPIQIPLRASSGGALLRQRRVIQLRAHTANLADRDKLTLECRPSTCGNDRIEDDHEACDDGNRVNGDGCNRGCQLE